MRAAWFIARTEIRRYRRSFVVLAMVIALSGAVSMTAAAGARRAATSFDRLEEVTRASDVRITSTLDARSPLPVAEVAALPGVAAAGELALALARPVGTEFGPFDSFGMVALDDQAMVDVERPRIIRGRMFDRSEPHDAVVNRTFADGMGIDVGDSFDLEAVSPEDWAAFVDADGVPSFDGARVSLRVVGVSHSGYDISDLAGFPVVLLSPAFWDRYGHDIAVGVRAVGVRLAPGHEVESFVASVRGVFGEGPLELDIVDELGGPRDAIRLVSVALWIFAAVAAAAGVAMVGQTISRHAATRSSANQPLRATGLTRPGTVGVAVLSIAPAIAGGVVLALAGAVGGSWFMPVGLARQAEPQPGMAIDAVVLLTGAFVLVLGLVLWTVLVSWRNPGMDRTSRALPGDAGFRLSDRVVAIGLPPSVAMGVHAAFTRGRGRAAVPLRTALAGSIVGVAGIAAAATFGASLSRLLDEPARYGLPFDLEFAAIQRGDLAERLISDLDVERLTEVAFSTAQVGDREMSIAGYEAIAGPAAITIVDGRLPTARDEVALGDATLRHLDVSVGDEVTARARDGGSVDLRVVGQGLLPDMDADDHAGGAIVTSAGLERLETGETFWGLLAGLDVDADPAVVAARYGTAEIVREPRAPTAVANFTEVDEFPAAVAGFLATLGVVAVGHFLVTSVRRRRHEIAVLRTLGFVRRQVAATLFVQVSTQMGLGLLVGIPLGLAVGRWGWAIAADDLGLATDPNIPVLTLVVLAVGALAFANLIAAPPARTAATTEAAIAFRTE